MLTLFESYYQSLCRMPLLEEDLMTEDSEAGNDFKAGSKLLVEAKGSKDSGLSSDDIALLQGMGLIRGQLASIGTVGGLIDWYVREKQAKAHQPESVHASEQAVSFLLSEKHHQCFQAMSSTERMAMIADRDVRNLDDDLYRFVREKVDKTVQGIS